MEKDPVKGEKALVRGQARAPVRVATVAAMKMEASPTAANMRELAKDTIANTHV